MLAVTILRHQQRQQQRHQYLPSLSSFVDLIDCIQQKHPKQQQQQRPCCSFSFQRIKDMGNHNCDGRQQQQQQQFCTMISKIKKESTVQRLKQIKNMTTTFSNKTKDREDNDKDDKNILRVWEYQGGGTFTKKANKDESKNKKIKLYVSATHTETTGVKKSLWANISPDPSSASVTLHDTSNNQIIRIKDNNSKETTKQEKKSSLLEQIQNSFSSLILYHFLPTGYPTTVSPTYHNYILYCFLANTAGSAAMVLSTQSLLLAVGVGSATAAPASAVFNWIMKDGIGQLGGVLFASRLGRASGTAASNVDNDPKRWRMYSSLCMDVSTLMEITSPLFPGYFLPIASVANIGKNIGFLSASASRASIHSSLCRTQNLGDVTAKAGSQSIASSLAGTMIGIGLSQVVDGTNVGNVALGFVVLSVIHQGCTYKSLRCVELESLNRHRLHLVLSDFVGRDCRSFYDSSSSSLNVTEENEEDEKNQEKKDAGNDHDSSNDFTSSSTTKQKKHPAANLNVLTPSKVAKRESFLPLFKPDDTHSWLSVGSPLVNLCPGGMEELALLRAILQKETNKKEEYIINCTFDDDKNDVSSPPKLQKVHLTFLESCTVHDVIRGMLHAHIIRAYANRELELPYISNNTNSNDTNLNIVQASHAYMMDSDMANVLLRDLKKAGWKVDEEHSSCVSVESGSSCRLWLEEKEEGEERK